MNCQWMKFVACVLLFCAKFDGSSAVEFESLSHIKSRTPGNEQTESVKELISRVIGGRSQEFQVLVDPSFSRNGKDTYQIITENGVQKITGSSGVAVAMGFYYYIKYYCNGQFTWAGKQVSLPQKLPSIPSPGIKRSATDRFRYYQNVCTVSYSLAWLNWTRWERHIDWMALNGINLPLAFTGQEAIFQRVYINMGLKFEDLEEHFGGPAFLAWARMGNIHGWGGPLPSSWTTDKLVLQHKILKRMRSLGMIPVLPGFAGHVPAAITKVYPNANVSRLSPWSRFGSKYSETTILEFEDPLFKKIGSSFIKEMQNEFGVDHIYNADSFNEMTPRSSDPSYLMSASRGVYEAMVEGDPQAIWLMQGWLFQSTWWKDPQIKALLTAIPKGKMIILDLFAELNPIYSRTQSFYGQPFIWCMLHNFGGTMEMYGDLTAVNEGPFTARNYTGSTMVGTGITPEGIFQNEIVYEFMNENSWRTEPRNISQWVSQYIQQRYGSNNTDAMRAWNLLQRSVYSSNSTAHFHGKDGFVKRPRIKPKLNGIHLLKNQDSTWCNLVESTRIRTHGRQTKAPNRQQCKPAITGSDGRAVSTDGSHCWQLGAWNLGFSKTVYNCTDRHADFDVVFLTRRPGIGSPTIWYDPADLYQAWTWMVNASQLLANNTLFRYDLVDITRNSLQVLSIPMYTDLIHGYNNRNLTAIQMAGNKLIRLLEDMEKLLASDTHFLLGNWIGDAKAWATDEQESALYEYNARNQITLWGPNGEIVDYASKQYSGLIADYYIPRWNHFIQTLLTCVSTNHTFDGADFNEMVKDNVEKPFTYSTKVYPRTTEGDSVRISNHLLNYYQKAMQQHIKSYKSLLKQRQLKHAQTKSRFNFRNKFVFEMEIGI